MYRNNPNGFNPETGQFLPDFLNPEKFREEVKKISSHKGALILLAGIFIIFGCALLAGVYQFFLIAVPILATLLTIVFAVLFITFCYFLWKPACGWMSAIADKWNRERIKFNPEQVIDKQRESMRTASTNVCKALEKVRQAKIAYSEDAKENLSNKEAYENNAKDDRAKLVNYNTELKTALRELDAARKNGANEDSIAAIEERVHNLRMQVFSIGANIETDETMIKTHEAYYRDSKDKERGLIELIHCLEWSQQMLETRIKSVDAWWHAVKRRIQTVQSTEEVTKYLVNFFTEQFGNPKEGEIAVNVLFDEITEATAATEQNMSTLNRILNLEQPDHHLLSTDAQVRELERLTSKWLVPDSSVKSSSELANELPAPQNDSNGGTSPRFR